MRIYKALLLIVFLGISAKVYADVTMTGKVTKPDDPSFSSTSIIYSTQDKLYFKNNEDRVDMFFDANKREMYIINHDERSYRVIDEEYMENVSEKLGSAMKQMEEQMAKMPEAQRKQMMKMLGDKMPQKKEISIKFEETGKTKSYNSWDTEKYLVYQNEDHILNYWVADNSEIDLDESDFEVYNKYSEFMDTLHKSLGSMFEAIGAYGLKMNFEELNGIPVITEQLDDDGNVERISKITDIDHSSIPAGTFEVPSSYEKQENEME